MAVKAAAGVDQQHAAIPRPGGPGREHRTRGRAQHRHREGGVGAVQIGVAPHHRHAKHLAGPGHAVEYGLGLACALSPEAVDQGQGPAAHGGDVAEVDQHAAPAGKPGVFLHQAGMETFAGEVQGGRWGGQQGGVIAQGGGGPQLGKGLVGKAAGRRLDVALAH